MAITKVSLNLFDAPDKVLANDYSLSSWVCAKLAKHNIPIIPGTFTTPDCVDLTKGTMRTYDVDYDGTRMFIWEDNREEGEN